MSASGKILDALMVRDSDSDPRYYQGKVWHDQTPECFRCTIGPAVLSAAYTVGAHRPSARQVTIQSFDEAIATHQLKDGSYGPPAPGEDGRAIQTVLFANALASSYLMLGSQLDANHRASWARSLTQSADYLIADGLTSFYVNGNINLAVAMNLDLTNRITGLDRFSTASVAALDFTLNPPQNRWPGFGLAYTQAPTRPDGSDGSGYLAESGGGPPGFDPAYTLNQSDIASMWFLLTGNKTAERLTNLMYNELAPRVRTSDWSLDVSGGTRRNKAGMRWGFTGSAMTVLALRAGRTDLQPLVASEAKAALRAFASATTYPHPSLSNGYGAQLAPTVYVISHTPGW